MSILTLELIGVLLAAWKAPGWVKEAGLLGPVTGVIAFLFGFYGMAEAIWVAGDIPPRLVFVGLRVASLAVIYGCLIYAVSLVIRIVHKPKLL